MPYLRLANILQLGRHPFKTQYICVLAEKRVVVYCQIFSLAALYQLFNEMSYSRPSEWQALIASFFFQSETLASDYKINVFNVRLSLKVIFVETVGWIVSIQR